MSNRRSGITTHKCVSVATLAAHVVVWLVWCFPVTAATPTVRSTTVHEEGNVTFPFCLEAAHQLFRWYYCENDPNHITSTCNAASPDKSYSRLVTGAEEPPVNDTGDFILHNITLQHEGYYVCTNDDGVPVTIDELIVNITESEAVVGLLRHQYYAPLTTYEVHVSKHRSKYPPDDLQCFYGNNSIDQEDIERYPLKRSDDAYYYNFTIRFTTLETDDTLSCENHNVEVLNAMPITVGQGPVGKPAIRKDGDKLVCTKGDNFTEGLPDDYKYLWQDQTSNKTLTEHRDTLHISSVEMVEDTQGTHYYACLMYNHIGRTVWSDKASGGIRLPLWWLLLAAVGLMLLLAVVIFTCKLINLRTRLTHSLTQGKIVEVIYNDNTGASIHKLNANNQVSNGDYDDVESLYSEALPAYRPALTLPDEARESLLTNDGYATLPDGKGDTLKKEATLKKEGTLKKEAALEKEDNVTKDEESKKPVQDQPKDEEPTRYQNIQKKVPPVDESIVYTEPAKKPRPRLAPGKDKRARPISIGDLLKSGAGDAEAGVGVGDEEAAERPTSIPENMTDEEKYHLSVPRPQNEKGKKHPGYVTVEIDPNGNPIIHGAPEYKP